MSTLSDFNRPGYKARVVAGPSIHSDLNLGLPIHPNKRDIVPLTDTDAIKQAVKNIVLTNFGEKLFRPSFGCSVSGRLFENVGQFTAIAIRDDIRIALKDFEPRVNVLNIEVIDNADSNRYDVAITFKIVNNPDTSQIEFSLNRLR